MIARLALAALAAFTAAMTAGLITISLTVMAATPQRIPVERDLAPFLVVPVTAPTSPVDRAPNDVWLENQRPHLYVETDVPEGMTLDDWRRSRAGRAPHA